MWSARHSAHTVHAVHAAHAMHRSRSPLRHRAEGVVLAA
jgi:hypothetical protein